MSASELLIRNATPEETPALVALWTRCGLTRAWNDPWRDIARAEHEPSTRIFIGEMAGQLVASAMVGNDGHRGWLYYLAVEPTHRGRGYGSRLIDYAEAYLIELGCPKLMMMVRSGQPALDRYYQSLGFDRNDVVVYGKRLIVDDPG